MMMMMIMIAGFVDSIMSPIKTWLDTVSNTHDDHLKNTSMVVKELGVGISPVECIVCLSEVASGERLAMLERCRHGFHVQCVEAWLKDHPNCPLCRTPISGSNEDTQKHRVYLKKLYGIMSCYGFCAVENTSGWLARVCTPVFLRASVTCDITSR
ncbi:RING-H2 finger protein ATL79 [Lactuca sativa]|uniref:RING-H2 finger protein ATL79 n=1 Tax=Lactuca sativa TaxID=4236 RepID=UPI000CD83860|nr:RING-H2 finger protein ATL79 [Lactuca sativa]